MGNTQKLGNYVNGIFQDASNNIGIGAAPSGTYKLEVTGTAKVSSTLLVSGAATFSSSVTATTLTANNTSGGAYIGATGATTQAAYGYFANTSGGFIFGTEGSAGGAIFTGSSAYSGAIGTYTAKDMSFGTYGAERMRITSGGIVTIPYQVSFKGYIISNVSLTKGVWVTIPYNGEEYDTQSNFSTSTYRFTAPVAGKYLFTVNFNAYSLDDTATLRLVLYINSSATRFLYGFANLPTGNTGDTNISGSDILNLSAGNTVEVRVLTDGSGTFNMSQDTTYNSFSGHLLG